MTFMKTVLLAAAATFAVSGAMGGLVATAHAEAKIFVVGGKADDPFWSIVKRGAEDAAKVVEAQGGTVTWLAPPEL
jgi:simple sugar transport system substrate-binding protein